MAGIGAGFAALSLVQKLTRVGIVLLVIVGVIGFVWWRIDSYGDSRYQSGRDDVDAEWAEANRKLDAQAKASATKADDRAAAKIEEFREQAAEDRKAVEDAQANGTSPLDAIFGP